MQRMFCDSCGEDMTVLSEGQLKGSLKVSVCESRKPTNNPTLWFYKECDICNSCMRKLFNVEVSKEQIADIMKK